MKISEITRLSSNDLSKKTVGELEYITIQLAGTVNRMFNQSMEKIGTTPANQSLIRSGGKITSRSGVNQVKNKNALIRDIIRGSHYYGLSTAGVTKGRQFISKINSMMNKHSVKYSDMSVNDRNKFWDTINTIKQNSESNGLYYDSNEAIDSATEVYINNGFDFNDVDVSKMVDENIKERYKTDWDRGNIYGDSIKGDNTYEF